MMRDQLSDDDDELQPGPIWGGWWMWEPSAGQEQAEMSKKGKGECCTYCRREMESIASRSKLAATKDHVIPKSKGGREKVWCCRQCNSIKGDMDPDQWQVFMDANPRWWLMEKYKNHGRMHKQPSFYARDIEAGRRFVLRGGFRVEK